MKRYFYKGKNRIAYREEGNTQDKYIHSEKLCELSEATGARLKKLYGGLLESLDDVTAKFEAAPAPATAAAPPAPAPAVKLTPEEQAEADALAAEREEAESLGITLEQLRASKADEQH